MATKQEVKKTKQPTALKRDLQNEKKRLNNRTYKSRARTAIRALEEAKVKGEAEETTKKLNEVYSILDKCAKKGIFKLNKVSRTKSRLTTHALS
jgi:small subunit ribosomal protein S20